MPKEMPKPVQLVYKDAVDNLVFIKRQEWLVTSYALSAYAALVTVVKAIPLTTIVGKLGFMATVVVIAYFSFRVLDNFDVGIQKFRKRLSWIYETYFDDAERSGLGFDDVKDDFNQEGFIAGLKMASLVGSAIAVLAIVFFAG